MVCFPPQPFGKRKPRSLFSLLALLCLACCLPTTTASAGQYRFRTLNETQGLNDLTVRSLAQDREGFLWIATHTGLYRYDGYRFRRYTSADGLAGDWFTDLTIDDEGCLWVAGAGGLSRYVDGGFQVVLPASESARFSPRFGSPLVGKFRGKVYVSTSSGIFAIELRGEETEVALPGPVWRRLLLGLDGGLAAAPMAIFARHGSEMCALVPENRMRCWDADTNALVREETLPAERPWATATSAADGRVYAATVDHEVYVSEQSGRGFKRLPVRYGGIGKLLVLRDGTLCVPDTQGFWLVDEDGAEHVKLDAGLAGIVVSQLLMDADGGFWIGTAGAGLVQWLGMRSWESWGLADGLPNATVSQIVFSEDGSQWLGTGQGLARRLPGKSRFQAVQPPGAPQGDNPVFGLAAGDAGAIWFSQQPGTLRYWNPGTGKTERLELASDSQAAAMVCHLLWHEGRLWIADTSGISRLRQEDGQWQIERMFPDTGEAIVAYRLAADAKGRVWAATQHGLVVMDGEQIERIGVTEGLLDRHVFGLSIAPHGDVVVHYRMPMGITELRALPGPAMRFTAHHFRVADGLASDKVYAVHADRHGNVWAGTENGLSVRNTSGQWVTYTQDDGLVWNDCAIGGLAEQLQEGAASSQTIWVGTSRGVSRFQPESRPSRSPVTAVVLGLVHGDETAADRLQRQASLPGRDFRVVYTAPRFTNHSLIRFRYRLDETSPWVETSERHASFASVGPGRYRFEVAAREPGGTWSKTPAAIEFNVPTPWWRRWWTILFALWMALAITRIVWRWRYRLMLKRQAELEMAVGERTQQLEVQREKAEAASRFKDQILANVSHEMRTPLNGILGYTDMVLGTNLTEEQREHLRTVQASGKTLVDIIEDLLDFAALESGQMNLQLEPVSLGELVEQTARSVRYEAESKGLTLSTHLDSGLPAYVKVDVHRLRQILMNLVGNAVKFSAGGHVRVTVGTLNRPAGGLEAGWQPGEPLTATFVVSDEGSGIPPEHLERIFEPFQQVDGSLQRRQGGAGLGLAIVKRITDALAGHVRAQSEVGKGSRFVVTLPLQSCGSPANKTTRSETPSKGSGASAEGASTKGTDAASSGPDEAAGTRAVRKVLIAEDNPVNQTLLVKILKTRGLHVVAVGNGQAAADAAENEHFDLILMDIQMPVMDGIEATRLIRSRERGQEGRVPIIAVTANGLFQCRQECLEVGMDGYVVKPFGPATLFEAIENVSQGRGTQSGGHVAPATPASAEGAAANPAEPKSHEG